MLVDPFENKPINLGSTPFSHSIKIKDRLIGSGTEMIRTFYPLKPIRFDPIIMQMYRITAWGIRCKNKMKIKFKGETTEEYFFFYFHSLSDKPF